MFTGIITDIGTITKMDKNLDSNKESWVDLTIGVKCSYDMDKVDIGASIACNGICLTVTNKQQNYFEADVSGETISKTTLRDWDIGYKINLERALKLSEELGGHLVSGHIDCVAQILSIKQDGQSHRIKIKTPAKYMKYIANKGSVVLNGTSLTVNEVDGDVFGVNIIQHTLENTIFCNNKENDFVNLEVDLLARYVARLLGKE